MATRATLKALVSADIVPHGNIRATELSSILNAIIDSIFDGDNITRLRGTFSSASSIQNDALIGNSLDNVIVILEGQEMDTGNLVESFNSTTGTIVFNYTLTGDYKMWILTAEQ